MLPVHPLVQDVHDQTVAELERHGFAVAVKTPSALCGTGVPGEWIIDLQEQTTGDAAGLFNLRVRVVDDRRASVLVASYLLGDPEDLSDLADAIRARIGDRPQP